MNNILKEEIERFQLLSKYDNKKTLGENNQSIIVINERGLFKGTVSKALAREIESVFKSFPTEMKKFGNDAVEVVSKLKARSYTSTELGELRTTIFKKTTDKATRLELANDMAKSKAWTDFFSSTKEKKVIDELIKKGYSGDDAKLLMDTYKRNGGKFLDDIASTSKGLSKNKTRTKRNYQDDLNSMSRSERKTTAEFAWQMIKDMAKGTGNVLAFVVKNFWKIFFAATTLTIAYYVWKYINEMANLYPECLWKNIPKDDFEKMKNAQLKYIKMSETGNEFIDENGGGRFYTDKKFETENGKFKGTWSDDTDLDIIIKLDNNDEQTILCQYVVDKYDKRDPREDETSTSTEVVKTAQQIEKEKIISSWDGKYTECYEFPMEIGCMNDGIIGTVQDCFDIPRDGRFSPQLMDALEQNGYGFTISFDIYKRIQNKCGMSGSQSGSLSIF